MGDILKIICSSDKFCRLDKYIVDLDIKELYSRTYIDNLIKDSLITVNGIPAKKSLLIRSGDVLQISLPEPSPIDVTPQYIPLDVIFEDEYLAVVNKPADLVVHPGHGNPDNTLVNAIVYKYGDKLLTKTIGKRPGIVHRLDKGTSGLIIIAKDEVTQSKLADMFAGRKVKKTYLAITTGVPEPPEDTISTNISRSSAHPRKMAVCNSGRLAITHYKVICFYHFFAVLQIGLETGRMHQIRVQFEHRNYPILGDSLYNSLKCIHSAVPDNMKKKVTELLTNHLKRQALHSWKLEFIHPLTDQSLSLIAPLPDDLVYTLNWLDKYFAIDNVSYREKLLISEKH